MADSPVQVTEQSATVQGQAQVTPAAPDNGRHYTHVVYTTTDRVITDANDPLAVQVPEGVGASHAGHQSPLGEALARGTVEDQFAAAEAPADAAPADESKTVEPEDTATEA